MKKGPDGYNLGPGTLQLKGRKTDWLNQGTARANGRRGPSSPDVGIFEVGNLAQLYHMSHGGLVETRTPHFPDVETPDMSRRIK